MLDVVPRPKKQSINWRSYKPPTSLSETQRETIRGKAVVSLSTFKKERARNPKERGKSCKERSSEHWKRKIPERKRARTTGKRKKTKLDDGRVREAEGRN